MKKAVVLFFISIFLFNSVGYFVVFKTAEFELKSEIKIKIKQGLPTKELVTLTIPSKELKTIVWHDGGKEFSYKGKMYDVVKSEQIENAITYYCIDDSKETNLFANLDEHINANVITTNTGKQHPTKKLNDHVVKIYFCQKNTFYFQSHPTTIEAIAAHQFMVSNPFLGSDTPPPRHA
jgi:hypothetical protein